MEALLQAIVKSPEKERIGQLELGNEPEFPPPWWQQQSTGVDYTKAETDFPLFSYYRVAVGPIHDLILNDILRFGLPTFGQGHRLKSVVVALGLVIWMIGVAWSDTTVTTDSELALAWMPCILFLIWIAYMKKTWKCTTLDWMNPQVPARHRRAMHVPLGLHTSVDQARKAVAQFLVPAPNAENVASLNGSDWCFYLYGSVEQALKQATNSDFVWDTKQMTVPMNWTLHPKVPDNPIYTNQKYPFQCAPPLIPHPNNPTGVYRKEVAWPKHWPLPTQDGSTYSIRLYGAESACYVYWNENRVGFSKDSRLPAEFDITPFVRASSSAHVERLSFSLTIVVIRWSDGSYVEDQDHWWMAGLHGRVELQRRPPQADIRNYRVVAEADGNLKISVDFQPSTSSKNPQKRKLSCSLYADASNIPQHIANYDPTQALSWTSGACLWRDDSIELTPTATVAAPIQTQIVGIHPWTAETPNLYTLVLELRNEAGQVTQVEACRIGFRTVEVDPTSGLLCLNQVPLLIRGINRHEHHPDSGKVVPAAQTWRDLCLLKQNNFNALRTSHYPQDTCLYMMANVLGVYIWDEANLETHGMKPMGRLAHDPGWKHMFVSRCVRTVARDYNYTSILSWSLGNEAGRGRNLWQARNLVKLQDSSRALVYESGGSLAEGTGATELTDVVCPMYPSVPRLVNDTLVIAKKTRRPVVLCEYSHSMGNSNGNLHLYWEKFYEHAELQGGFIWDMIDQGLRLTAYDGRTYFGYGGDFGDRINDLQFCINGMFSPDRKPHPAVAEIKFLQQPVIFRPSTSFKASESLRVTVSRDNTASLQLQVINRYQFFIDPSAELNFTWVLVSDRSTQPIRQGKVSILHGCNAIVNLDAVISRVVQLEKTRAQGSKNSYHLNLRGKLRHDTSWAPAGHVLVTQQFPVEFSWATGSIPCLPPTPSKIPPAPLKVGVDVTEHQIVVRSEKDSTVFSPIVVIDKRSGVLLEYYVKGENVLLAPIVPNFSRAATDNDRGGFELVISFMFPKVIRQLCEQYISGPDFSYFSRWTIAGLDPTSPPDIVCSQHSFKPHDEGLSCEVRVTQQLRHRRMYCTLLELSTTYRVFGDGQMKLSYSVTPRRVLRSLGSLPRVGLTTQLVPALSKICYYGRGPDENYPDRKSGGEMGVYDSTLWNFGFDYIFPTENGSRSDVEWITFADAQQKTGVLISAGENSSFSASALPYTARQLEAAAHTCDLPDRNRGEETPICVNIDHRLMGVGGDTSWYPTVYPEFQVPSTDSYNFSLFFSPLQGKESAVLARELRKRGVAGETEVKF